MKQILQGFKNGKLQVDDVPAPMLKNMGAIVQTRISVVSVGTERAVTEFASLSSKAHSVLISLSRSSEGKSDGLMSHIRQYGPAYVPLAEVAQWVDY